MARSDAYKSTAKLGELDSFRIPDFMLQKMKIFFTELSLRSQTFVVHPVQPASVEGMSTIATTSNSVATPNSSGGYSSTGYQQIGGGTAPARARSSLSSSHATLSALLSGGSIVGQQISPTKSSVSSKMVFQVSKEATAGPSSVLVKQESV